MIASNILPLLIFTIFILLICPILTTVFIYYCFELKTKPKTQKIFINSLSSLLTLLFMFILQRQFPYSIEIWFALYFMAITILTIIEHRKQKKKHYCQRS